MNGALIGIEGAWGHFKKPETNNNPLTHDFITKTALSGLIGAVTGKSRIEMKPLFPQLSEDLQYGVQVIGEVQKESWAFTLRKAVNQIDKAPKHMEFLHNPKFLVAIALFGERSQNVWIEFLSRVKVEEAIYTPVLGIHNCPANLHFIKEGIFEKRKGEFSTYGFVKNPHKIQIKSSRKFRIGFDKIPTYQNNDFWNLPDRYIEVIYPTNGNTIEVNGEYFQFSDGSNWVLV